MEVELVSSNGVNFLLEELRSETLLGGFSIANVHVEHGENEEQRKRITK